MIDKFLDGWIVFWGVALMALATPVSAQMSMPTQSGGQDEPARQWEGEQRAKPDGSVIRTKRVTASLISENTSLQPGTTAWLALHFHIVPKWHTYWRNAGDSGEATRIQWILPPDFKAGNIQWLPPQRIAVGPLVNYGYSYEAVHMVPITVPASAKHGQEVTLTAKASWLVCADICIPEEGTLNINLLVSVNDPIKDLATAPTFKKSRAALPKPSPWSAEYRFDGDRFRLDVAAADLRDDIIKDAWFYPYHNGVLKYAARQLLTVTDHRLSLETTRDRSAKPFTNINGLLVIRETGGDGNEAIQALEIQAAQSIGSNIGFWEAVLLAVLGGLILNLMPCVFPVLAMKALSFAEHASNGKSMGPHGLVYSLGVLVAFGIAGAVLLGLRSAGNAAGWGFQLQEPIFVLLMAYLMILIGLNFAGLYEISSRFVGVGSSLTARSGLSGSFFTGVLAVIVAAPCTAPFMGAAIGFALGQPPISAMAVILALGLGLAMPFLLLSFAPRLLHFIPKTGPWMIRFKQFLAFPMFATAAWLIWVLSLQAGDAALLGALIGAILLAFAIWLWQVSSRAARTWRNAGIGLAAVAVLAALGMARLADQGVAVTTSADNAKFYEVFSEATLEEYRTTERPVFVNFTAAWCITCIANEKIVLRRESVVDAMKRAGMVYMKGDWTRRDPVISRQLSVFGREGVPLYVIFPPASSSRQPLVLPQLLTESYVLQAIRQFELEKRLVKKAEK
ncbi:MAG: protein-disulfide reductase DsbD family protein [Rhodospirillaceae bacterium]|nr:protein-disulfide reductase DsbD family protein [Rhodospirillaceae bacterium]